MEPHQAKLGLRRPTKREQFVQEIRRQHNIRTPNLVPLTILLVFDF